MVVFSGRVLNCFCAQVNLLFNPFFHECFRVPSGITFLPLYQEPLNLGTQGHPGLDPSSVWQLSCALTMFSGISGSQPLHASCTLPVNGENQKCTWVLPHGSRKQNCPSPNPLGIPAFTEEQGWKEMSPGLGDKSGRDSYHGLLRLWEAAGCRTGEDQESEVDRQKSRWF